MRNCNIYDTVELNGLDFAKMHKKNRNTVKIHCKNTDYRTSNK